MDEEGDPSKILRVPEEFAKAKRNLLFWCAITLTVIAAHAFQIPSNETVATEEQSFKLLVVDATIPYWFARTAAWTLATFMLVGFWRSVNRLDLMNSQLGRLHDTESTTKIFKETIGKLEDMTLVNNDLRQQTRTFKHELDGWRHLSDTWNPDDREVLERRIRNLTDPSKLKVAGSPQTPLQIAELELRQMDSRFRASISNFVSSGLTVETANSEREKSVENISQMVIALEKRLADLTSYSKTIHARDLAWLSWWDKGLPMGIYFATASQVLAASIA